MQQQQGEGGVSSPPSAEASTSTQKPTNKRGWKFDNPCLMCKKGNSKILGANAELPCTCGGKPSKKRSITAEAFNPFALSSSGPSFVPPTKIVASEIMPEPPVAAPEPPQMLLHLPRQPHNMLSHSAPASYQPSNQRPLSFSRPIPISQTHMSAPIPIQHPPQTSQFPVLGQQHIPPPQQQQQHIPPSPQQHVHQPSFHVPPVQTHSPQPAAAAFPKQANPMGSILYNILDEMKQLSAITQQLKDEHNSFVDQVEKLKKKNKDMQQLIDVGTEPITAFVQVARDDLTSSDVMALLRAKVSSEAKYRRPSAPPPQEEEELNVPFVVTDSTKPFMVFRPVNLELSAKELSLLFDQNRLSKSAKSKLRIERIAVSEAFCKLLNYPRDDLLQTKNPRKIIRAKHKKHFFLKLAPQLLKKSNSAVSPLLAFEPRFMTKEGTILFTSSRMQVWYKENGDVSFFIVCIETITKTHVPRYLEVKQAQRAKIAAKNATNNNNTNNMFMMQSNSILSSNNFNSNINSNKMVIDRGYNREEDGIFRSDEDFELSPEEEAFLEGATYPYFLPPAKLPTFAPDTFASPVGSPSSPSSFSPPASPVVGGCISVGTLDSFSEDYSWLLSDHSTDPLPLAI